MSSYSVTVMIRAHCPGIYVHAKGLHKYAVRGCRMASWLMQPSWIQTGALADIFFSYGYCVLFVHAGRLANNSLYRRRTRVVPARDAGKVRICLYGRLTSMVLNALLRLHIQRPLHL